MNPIKLICGETYRLSCQYVYNGTLGATPAGKADTYYVFQKDLAKFSTEVLPKITSPSIIITSTSDNLITEQTPGAAPILNCPYVTRWLASNVHMIHPKLYSIPIGIGFDGERPGVQQIVKETMEFDIPKRDLVYASYTISTNPGARQKCFDETKLLLPWTGFRENLEAVARSLFVISPNGNGFDCHRHWEAIYLKTIPIVIDDNINIRFYRNMPFLLLKNWSEFRTLNLCLDTYHKIWNQFNVEELDVDRYLLKATTDKNPLLP